MKAVQAGTLDILLAHTGTGIHAIGNACTHRGCRLSDGTLEGKRCTAHATDRHSG